MKRLTITEAREGDRLRLYVSGELDLTTRDDLINTVMGALDGQPDGLDLDLSGVGFCDSSGISGLLAVRRMSRGVGKRVVVVNPQQQVERSLAISGVLDELAGG